MKVYCSQHCPRELPPRVAAVSTEVQAADDVDAGPRCRQRRIGIARLRPLSRNRKVATAIKNGGRAHRKGRCHAHAPRCLIRSQDGDGDCPLLTYSRNLFQRPISTSMTTMIVVVIVP